MPPDRKHHDLMQCLDAARAELFRAEQAGDESAVAVAKTAVRFAIARIRRHEAEDDPISPDGVLARE
jgi:hypothetical protein